MRYGSPWSPVLQELPPSRDAKDGTPVDSLVLTNNSIDSFLYYSTLSLRLSRAALSSCAIEDPADDTIDELPLQLDVESRVS